MATKKTAEDTAKKTVETLKETGGKAKKVTKEVIQTTQASGKKVEHNITQVQAQSSNAEELQHITKGNATPYRIIAIVLLSLIHI